MFCDIKGLTLWWKHQNCELPLGSLDERFLLGHNHPPHTSFPFLPDIQTVAMMCRSMAAMVATKRHFWVNLADTGEKEKNILLNVSPSEFFGTLLVWEAKVHYPASKTFIPRWSHPEVMYGFGHKLHLFLIKFPLLFNHLLHWWFNEEKEINKGGWVLNVLMMSMTC